MVLRRLSEKRFVQKGAGGEEIQVLCDKAVSFGELNN
jgi:hypothetical protein